MTPRRQRAERCQVREVRAHRPGDERAERRIDPLVYPVGNLVDGPVPSLDRGRHFGKPLGAVRDVVVEDAHRIGDQRSMARHQQADRRRTRQRVQPVERPQVITEVPIARDHRRTTAEHGVTGEHGPVRGQQEAEGIGRMPRARNDPQLTPTRRNHVSPGQPFPAEPVRGIERPNGCAGDLGQPPCTARVVAMPMREQDQRDPAPLAFDLPGHPAEVTFVRGTRIDHNRRIGPRLGYHPRVCAVQGHRRRVGGEHTARTRRT